MRRAYRSQKPHRVRGRQRWRREAARGSRIDEKFKMDCEELFAVRHVQRKRTESGLRAPVFLA